MSWLPIEAVILVCRLCDWSLQVDINKRGPIQIGDDNIALILSMYRDNKNAMQVPEGFFESYHTMPVGCICHECYMHQAGASEQTKIDVDVQHIMDSFDQIIESHSSFKNRHNDVETLIMGSWLQGIDFEWARQINEKVYNRTLGHANFARPDQRTQLIKQFVAEGKSSIMQSALDHFFGHQEIQALQDKYTHVIEPWLQQINLLLDNIRKKQRDPIVRAYEHLDKTKPINLNNHICYEGTLAYPSDDCAEYYVYMPIQYNLNQGDQWLQERLTLGDSMPGEKAIINEVRKKLLTMVSG